LLDKNMLIAKKKKIMERNSYRKWEKEEWSEWNEK
jgi:hypothetical protein